MLLGVVVGDVDVGRGSAEEQEQEARTRAPLRVYCAIHIVQIETQFQVQSSQGRRRKKDEEERAHCKTLAFEANSQNKINKSLDQMRQMLPLDIYPSDGLSSKLWTGHIRLRSIVVQGQ